MRKTLIVGFALLLVGMAHVASFAQADAGTIHQISTIVALQQGMLDGTTTFGELKKLGDFGVGTVNGLDGEMIALDGKFYRIGSDGKVSEIADSVKTPWAVVYFFKPDKKSRLPAADGVGALHEALDRMLPDKNLIYTIRIDGVFKYLKVRSVPKQVKPYPSLAEVIKKQSVFELRDVQGTMVGTRFPRYMKGINVPGYHFHFITADRNAGGHLLDCRAENLTVELSSIRRFDLTL